MPPRWLARAPAIPTPCSELAAHPDADVVLNAVVGFAGLPATLAALQHGKRLALANKESLIAGGPVVAEPAPPAAARSSRSTASTPRSPGAPRRRAEPGPARDPDRERMARSGPIT